MDSGPEHDPEHGDGQPGRRRRLRRKRAGSTEPSGRRIRLRRRPKPLLPDPSGPDEPQKRSRPRLRKLRFAFVILGLTALALVSWIFGIMMAVAQDLPELESREQYKRSENSIVYDAYGQKLATLTNNQGRVFVNSAQIAPVMKEAVVAIEDQRFYEHSGVDFQGIARAVWQDVTSGSAQQGASTITQQFVKNALAAQDSRTVFQKLREAALAYHLERQWPKDKILTEYLNEIYFGEGATGIEAAARTYFGWNHPGCGESGDPCASELLPWEAALLAGMISSPSAYSPRDFPENALARRNQVLTNMVQQGYITQEEYDRYSPDQGETAIPTAKEIQPPAENSAAPYFTSWLRQQLVDRYGAGEAFGGGLQIKSTLDLELQRQAEGIVSSTLSGVGPTASVVVLDNKTANVLAMVGGPSYQDAPFNLATNGHRQPGSSFKPFTLVTALEQGHSPDEVFTSAPQQIPFRAKVKKKHGKGDKVVNELFKVNNYDDSYLGSASITSATTYSDNSVYSQLGTQVGPQNVAATAAKMGVETDLSTKTKYSIADGPFEPYNPALILGGLEVGVTPLEMAHAYNTLAADGNRLSGTMAADDGGPVGIIDVYDGGDDCEGSDECYQQGDAVPDETGRERRQQDDRQAGDRPGRRLRGQVDPLDRGLERHRTPRPDRRPDLGQDRHHRRQRRRVVLRCHAEDHRLRVGWVPGRGDPDGDRVRRRARRRRDLPRPDLLPRSRGLRLRDGISRRRQRGQGRRQPGRLGGHRGADRHLERGEPHRFHRRPAPSRPRPPPPRPPRPPPTPRAPRRPPPRPPAPIPPAAAPPAGLQPGAPAASPPASSRRPLPAAAAGRRTRCPRRRSATAAPWPS